MIKNKRSSRKKKVKRTIYWFFELLLLAIIVLLATNFVRLVSYKIEYNKYPDRGVARLEIILKDVTLEEIRRGSKDIKYEGNEARLFNEGTITSFQNVEIKGRGNSTWTQKKKPYQIKLSSRENLLGLGRAKKWVLLANYFDASNMRTDVAMLMAGMLGEKYNHRGDFVEVYFDGEYVGLYYLVQKIEIAKGSVDLRENGSVLFEMDNIHRIEENCYDSYFGECLILKDSVLDDGENEKKIAENFMEKFDELERLAKRGQYEEVARIIDTESFAEYYLISEFTANPDAYASSFYFYRNGDSKIYAGPVWDFDFALANREWCWQVDEKIFTPDESMARRQEAFGENGLREDLNISKLYYYLMDMPEFKDEVIRVYQERLAGRKDEFIKELRDRADVIRKAANVNNERWERKSFDSDFDELMDFVEKRYEFFEKEFSDGKTVVPLRSAF